MVKELGRLREEKTKGKQDYLSLEGYTVSMPRATPGDSRMQGKISLEGYTPAKMAAQAALSWHQVTPSRRFVCDISLVGSPPSVLHVKSKQESTSRSTNAGTKSSQTPERNRHKLRNEIVTNSGTKSSQMPEQNRHKLRNEIVTNAGKVEEGA